MARGHGHFFIVHFNHVPLHSTLLHKYMIHMNTKQMQMYLLDVDGHDVLHDHRHSPEHQERTTYSVT